ncbi:FdrA family protein [Nocardioides dilutus]
MSDTGATHVELRRGAYADSVTLLQVSRTVQGVPGVATAQVAMATPLNVEVLTEMGFAVPEEAGPNDMVVAIRLADGGDLDAALAGVDAALRETGRRDDGPTQEAPPRTTGSALRRTPGAIALVSVPGPSAFVEAMDALEAGSDVMVFSDHVPVKQELALKRYAAERSLLVMGPDCGTAVVGGLGLGFANVVSPGPVGIVAASGTGCQQVLALLDHAGVGVASALGVGGRDLSAEVRGLATREAMRRLDADPRVELMLLVSKPPADDVADEIRAYAAGLSTPVEMALLGAGHPDLTEATEALLLARGVPVPDWPVSGRAATPSGGRYLRGLFVGGTLAGEARIVAQTLLGADRGHTFVDFGDDAYTAGRAHPMIDPTLRLEHLARAGADPETAVVLLDVVLGHGAEPDPAALLAPAVAAIDKPVVVAVVGTAADPQGLERQVRALADAGAEVHLSNAHATRRAVELLP